MPKRKQLHKKPSPSDRKPKVCQYCGDFVNSDFYGKHGPKLTECYGRSMPTTFKEEGEADNVG